MKTALINNELSVTYPNAFRDMELVELQLAFGVTYKCMWGIRDDRHSVIIAIIWKEANEFLQRLVSTKSMAKSYEKAMRKSLRGNDYTCDGFFSGEVAGREAQGFRYSYERDGIGQVGEATVFRRGRANYTLYYYTRPEKADDNNGMYRDLIASLSFQAGTEA